LTSIDAVIGIAAFFLVTPVFYLLRGWIGFALFALLFWGPLLPGRVVGYLLMKGLLVDDFRRTGVYPTKLVALFYVFFWFVPDGIVLYYQDALLMWVVDFPLYLRFLGLAIFLIFVVFCGWMLLHLGWRARLTGKPEEKLVVTGAYAYVRHPEYSSESWALLGIFLMSGAMAVLILLALWAVFVYPVTVWEERELLERFGEEYEEYRKRVPRLLKLRRKR